MSWTTASPLPSAIEWAKVYGKYIVVHLPSQVFGAYENGHLVRWGPVSSGRAAHPTPSGLFHLNCAAADQHRQCRVGSQVVFQFLQFQRTGTSRVCAGC
jgi:hypothetical protein